MRRIAAQPPELPGYTYVKVLGSGGFSDVYLYEQHLPKRRVAVKVLLAEGLTPASRAAFVAEANVMAQLSAHPYIVSIYDAGVSSDDRPYLVMEFAPGASLADLYKREPFTAPDALRTGIRLSSAIATAHSAGILHRDIKPANVLSNDFGWPALTDFGIASALEDEAITTHTVTRAEMLAESTGTTAGTTESQSIGMSVPWSPPEMFSDDPRPDIRSDVFSLVATIYTLVAGHTPFEIPGRSNGALDLIGRIERGTITPLTRTDLPRSFVAVLLKGMSARPEDRFQSAIDFARALQRVELELGYVPTAIDVPNLVSTDDHRPAVDDDADATRARGVATIEAQPVSAAPTVVGIPPMGDDATRARAATPIVAQPPLPESTVIRGNLSEQTVVVNRHVPVAPDPAAPPAAPVVAEQKPKRSRGAIIGLWAGSAAVVLIAGAVTAGIIIGGVPGPDPLPDPRPTSSGGSAIVTGVPTPTVLPATVEGETLVFAVENPDPQDGDAFIWRRVDSTDDHAHVVEKSPIVVDSYTAGSNVCIEVMIRRAGQTSPVPQRACYPE